MSRLQTIWTGSALNCGSGGNEILLLNSTPDNEPCNNEINMITGRVIKREEDNYTSQLNIILSSDLIGKNIECVSGNGTHSTAISNITLDIIICMRACSYTSLPFCLCMYITNCSSVTTT